MKRFYFLMMILLIFSVCTAGCKKDVQTDSPTDNNVVVTLPVSASDTISDRSDDTQTVPQPSVTVPPTTEEPTQAGPSAAESYRNEYTAYGYPSVLYEVIGSGEAAVYSGIYNRYVYSGNTLITVEKWSKSETGDSLISTTDYTYDGRGHLTRTEERIPDTQGNLYTYCLTEMVNNTDGDVATKSISYLHTDGTTKQQTVYGYTYDDYGWETLCTVTEDGSFVKQTETEYTFDGNTLVEQTQTTTRYPGTPYEQVNVLTQTFDANGNILTISENDTGIHYTTSYEYDAYDREVGSRTVLADDTVSEYTVTAYEDLGGGCTRVTKRLFTADGALYETQITCTDAYGNIFIPEE